DFGPLRTVSGTITRASDGTPVGGVVLGCKAGVVELTETEGQAFPTATSAEDGAFKYPVPVSATALVLTLPANKATQDYPLPRSAEDLDVDIVFDSGFRIEGHVT